MCPIETILEMMKAISEKADALMRLVPPGLASPCLTRDRAEVLFEACAIFLIKIEQLRNEIARVAEAETSDSALVEGARDFLEISLSLGQSMQAQVLERLDGFHPTSLFVLKSENLRYAKRGT